MRQLELSIDGNNYRTNIRDAVLGAIPNSCYLENEAGEKTERKCPIALDRAYEIGQIAAGLGKSPEKAAADIAADLKVCCKECVFVELLQVPPVLNAGRELQPA
jgi:hypothetical protein